MTPGGELVENVVSMIRSNGDLVSGYLDGDETAVFAYKENYPHDSKLLTAIEGATRPSVMVAYGGFRHGDHHKAETDKHKILIYVRSGEGVDYGYESMAQLILDGITSDGVKFRYSTIHENCFPPEKPDFHRVMHDSLPSDFWELSFLLTEIFG